VTGGTGHQGQVAVANVNTEGGNGGGGAGVQATADVTVTGTGVVTGGMGAELTGGGGGGGGAGIFSSADVTVNAGGKVTGGAGNTALAPGAGGGGQGAAAIVLTGNGTVQNSGTLTGGNGERGLTSGGGDGGAGVELVSGSTVVNTASGTITGGAGGGGRVSLINAVPTSPGAGGAGITGSGISVVNAGTIAGGAGATGTGWTPVNGDAIQFTGGVNSLEIWSTSNITGNVVAFSAADTLKLGGTTSASFDVSQIGPAAQYQGFGVFEKVGSSTWTLTGTTTAVTPWTLTDGILQIASDTSLGDPSGGLTFNGGTLENTADVTSARTVAMQANGTLLTDPGTTLTLNGAISGSGALTKAGTCTLILNANNAYTGGTTISAGTLQLGSGGTTGSIVGAITNDGTLLFDRSDTLTLNGAISGSGNVNQIGSGTTILAADNSYTGGTTITSGTLQLGNGGATGSIVGAVVDNGALVLDSGGIMTLGAISGTGSVTQNGSGTTLLTGNNSYTGSTHVNAGTLALGDASGTSASLGGGAGVQVASGATFGGNGSVNGNVVNDGTIAVANAIPVLNASANGNLSINGTLTNAALLQLGGRGVGNTLTIAGNYIGESGSTLALNARLDADNSPADKLVLNGGATSGSTVLKVANVGGNGALTTSNGIQVVEATHGATTAAGAFTGGTVSAGAFTYELFHGGVTPGTENDWYLRSVLNAQALASSASANAGSRPAPIPIYRAAVPLYAEAPSLAREMSIQQLGTFHDRIGSQNLLDATGALPAGWARVWGDHYADAHDGTVNQSFSGTIAGMQVGQDIYANRGANGDSNHYGFFLGYTHGGGDVDGFALGQQDYGSGNLQIDAYSIGAYWTHLGASGWYTDTVLMGTTMSVGPESNAGDAGHTHAHAVTASVEGGLPIPLAAGFAIEPQAQLIYQNLQTDDLTDSVSRVSFNSSNEVIGRLGARLTDQFAAYGTQWQPYMRADVLRYFGGTDTATFANTTPIDSSVGSTQGHVGVGLSARVTPKVALYATAGYWFNLGGPHRETVEGDAGVRLNW
jgi:outer membrane autotransporter protein